MKKYPFLEAIGAVDEKYLKEVFEDKEQERRHITMSKKKLVTIMIAAALVVAIGVTTAAASWSRLNQLSDYFDEMKDTFRIPEEVPIINDPATYGKEVNTNVTTAANDDTEPVIQAAEANGYTLPAPGTAQITTVSATKYSIFMTIEFNAEGLDIPDELPDDAKWDAEYDFEWADTNFWWAGGKAVDISREGNIFTYLYSWNHIYEFPEDEIVITLQRFGYLTADKSFNTLRDIEVEVRLPVGEISVMDSISSKNSVNMLGAEYTAELSPYDLAVRTSLEDLISNGLSDEIGYMLTDDMQDYLYSASMEFHLTDGTVFISNLGTFDKDAPALITSRGALRDPDEGTSTMIYCFEVPIDISQIDYIVLNGNRFDFASAE